MSIRLVVTITAAPGKGSELAQAYKARCAEARKEPGCEQFEIFQGVADPDLKTHCKRGGPAILQGSCRALYAKPAVGHNVDLSIG